MYLLSNFVVAIALALNTSSCFMLQHHAPYMFLSTSFLTMQRLYVVDQLVVSFVVR